MNGDSPKRYAPLRPSHTAPNTCGVVRSAQITWSGFTAPRPPLRGRQIPKELARGSSYGLANHSAFLSRLSTATLRSTLASLNGGRKGKGSVGLGVSFMNEANALQSVTSFLLFYIQSTHQVISTWALTSGRARTW